jgi:hypothetical protein
MPLIQCSSTLWTTTKARDLIVNFVTIEFVVIGNLLSSINVPFCKEDDL